LALGSETRCSPIENEARVDLKLEGRYKEQLGEAPGCAGKKALERNCGHLDRGNFRAALPKQITRLTASL